MASGNSHTDSDNIHCKSCCLASLVGRAVSFCLKVFFQLFAEDEINLLVIVVDVNPIWWGLQAQREPEVLVGLVHGH